MILCVVFGGLCGDVGVGVCGRSYGWWMRCVCVVVDCCWVVLLFEFIEGFRWYLCFVEVR